jgi:hypothetical protein
MRGARGTYGDRRKAHTTFRKDLGKETSRQTQANLEDYISK